MKKVIFIILSISALSFSLMGCNKDVTTRQALNDLKQENERIIEKNNKLENELVNYKEKLNKYEQQDSQPLVSIDDISNLLWDGEMRFFHVSSGGDIKEYKTLTYNGNDYRYLGEDLDTKRKIIDYLEMAYTPGVVTEIISTLKITEYQGKMVQPNADYGNLLDWKNATYKNIKLNKSSITIHLKVPLGDTGQFDEIPIEFKYQDGIGWRINSHLYFRNN